MFTRKVEKKSKPKSKPKRKKKSRFTKENITKTAVVGFKIYKALKR